MARKIRKAVIVLIYLVLWQLLSVCINNKIYFVGPIEVIKELGTLAVTGLFWKTIFFSFLRITLGFVIAFFIAYLLSVISYRFEIFEDILSPLVTVMKSVPVASVVVILLIWYGAKWLTIYVTFMVVFPNIYINILEGLKSTDEDMLEMAASYKMPFGKVFKYIYKPAFISELVAATKVSIGMSFKSGVAAEIIALPAFSIGERIYMDKIYLNTAGVFAWTFVLILISVLTEKIVMFIIECYAIYGYGVKIESGLMLEKRLIKTGLCESEDVLLEHANGRYGDHVVIEDFSYDFEKGRIYSIMGASGKGKTTLLNMIESLYPDSKRMYQENRLCEIIGGASNILITNPAHTVYEVIWYMTKAGLGDVYMQPVSSYSGGMKRRVALLRALLSDSSVLLLDEPFTGLDEESKRNMQALIFELQKDRCIIFTSHDEEDALRLGAQIIKL